MWRRYGSNWQGLIPESLDGTPQKTNMAMENPPFEDVFPIKDGDVPLC